MLKTRSSVTVIPFSVVGGGAFHLGSDVGGGSFNCVALVLGAKDAGVGAGVFTGVFGREGFE